MKIGISGSLESNDALITVKPCETQQIVIKSVVYDFFHDQIETVIKQTLKDLDKENLSVLCEDKGALDYTIRARLVTAIRRMEESK